MPTFSKERSFCVTFKILSELMRWSEIRFSIKTLLRMDISKKKKKKIENLQFVAEKNYGIVRAVDFLISP